MALQNLDIGNELSRGWRLFKENMGMLILASVLMVVISSISLGILAGPMLAGMFLLIQRLLKNDPIKPQAGDIFKGLDYFGASFLLVFLVELIVVVLCIIPVINILAPLAGLLSALVILWGMSFVVFQKCTATDALRKVFAYIKSGEFTIPLVFALIISIIGGLGSIVCGIGVFFTIPLAYCQMVCGYDALFNDVNVIEPEVIEPIEVEPPPPPPSAAG